ncbi:MAG TPA: hypothetical protein VMJ34_08785 [Bryobacteraceae bacterium]|nr:hypothetical protein [Bryobacteraceae bacterium]
MISEIAELVRLLRRKHWTREQIDELRRAKLRRLIHHAYANVPYYTRLMDGAGVKPEDIREPSDLRRIPTTTKTALRRAGNASIAAGARPTASLHTSGHSGIPFEVRMTPAEYRTRRLREFRMLIGIGVHPRDRLTLLGPVRTRSARLHRMLGLYRMDVIPLTLAPDEILRRFRASNPDVLWAYPNTFESLLQLAGCPLGELARPRFMINSSNVLPPPLQARLRADLPEMEIAHIYGSAEAGRIAAECRARRGLHLEDDALIVELLNDGEPVAPGEEGGVVLTCLDQLTAPLIRYEQGDICRLKPEPCTCGWQTPLMDLPLGRDTDMMTLPSGLRVPGTRLDIALRGELDLLQYRFVQEQRDRIRAELCFDRLPSPAELTALQGRMEDALGEPMSVDIELIPEAKFEATKFRTFVSRL